MPKSKKIPKSHPSIRRINRMARKSVLKFSNYLKTKTGRHDVTVYKKYRKQHGYRG